MRPLNLPIILAIQETHPERGRARIAVGCNLLLEGLAALEEVSQRYIATRTFGAWDILTDVVGILSFGALARVMSQRVVENPSDVIMGRRA